MQVHKND